MAGAGLAGLREAALADFDPREQAWRWHATVAEYARAHWPLAEEAQRARQVELLPAWTAWLERLPAETAPAHLEATRPNLEALLDLVPHPGYDRAKRWFQALHRALPLPDRTLVLRDFEGRVYRAWSAAADEAGAVEDRATALGMTGYALSALGRREEALAATEEAVAIRRELARANPPAFLPDLAMSLNNLGTMLSDLGRREEALAAYEEAVRTLAPFFQRFPTAFAAWMETMVRNYTEAQR